MLISPRAKTRAALCAVLMAGFLGVAGGATPASDPVLLAAGDIAACDSTGDEQTAALLGAEAGTIQTLGDNAYDSGTAAEFASCYDPSWGQFKDRTRPAIGNHEYATPGAAGYFGYFGGVAGKPGQGWYSYDLGAWHIVVLNADCGQVDCRVGSQQESWLRGDLAASGAACILAVWHQPRFSSGEHGGAQETSTFWRALLDYGADLVLSGHDHDYERFAPQDASGNADPKGIREFVVGTGGVDLRPFATVSANSEVRAANTFGVLKLTLSAQSYGWEFLPVAGQTFTDAGTATCSPFSTPPPGTPAQLPPSAQSPSPASATRATNSKPAGRLAQLISIGAGSVLVSRQGLARVRLECLIRTAPGCRGRLTLRARLRSRAAAGGTAIVASRSFALPARSRRPVAITLSRRARGWLSSHAVLWARALVTVRGVTGESASVSRRLELKAAPRKRLG